MIRRLIKLVLFLVVLGFAGLAGFAYLGDLSPDQSPQSVTVTLDGQ